MKYLIAIILLLSISACTMPPEMQTVLGNGDVSMGGTCEIDEAGWHIEYIEKYDRHVFTFWVEGGECDYDE